jgi:hypothetical protein
MIKQNYQKYKKYYLVYFKLINYNIVHKNYVLFKVHILKYLGMILNMLYYKQ